jgi:hypothetical protein
MPEVKKGGGFHAFEQRVHQIEEEDAKAQRSAPGQSEGAAKRETSKEERKEPKK